MRAFSTLILCENLLAFQKTIKVTCHVHFHFIHKNSYKLIRYVRILPWLFLIGTSFGYLIMMAWMSSTLFVLTTLCRTVSYTNLSSLNHDKIVESIYIKWEFWTTMIRETSKYLTFYTFSIFWKILFHLSVKRIFVKTFQITSLIELSA